MKRLLVFLLACLTCSVTFGQDLHYSINGMGVQSGNLKITCTISVDGNEIYNGDQSLGGGQLEIGVFDQDGECRGAKLPKWRAQSSQWIYSLQIKGNTGYTYTFRIYDHATETEMDLVYTSEETITFVNGGIMGSSTAPYLLNFTNPSSGETFTKDIVGYGTNDGGYYFIASPIDNVDPATIEGMTYPYDSDNYADFDLFSFDESQEEWQWRNYKAGAFDHLMAGQGYLYARKTDVQLSVTGTPNPDPECSVTLYKTDGAPMSGWNLVGNPFGTPATIGRDYYIMEGEGYVAKTSADPVQVWQGILVDAEYDGETMTFSALPGKKGSNLSLNLTSESSLVDRAIVSFDNGRNLSKITFRKNDSKLYMPVDGKDYAVVHSEAQGEMPVNFKAEKNGTYTLSFNTENVEFGYLHLIDNMTGNDIDLLATPSYSFDANVTDYASRFKLVFATSDNNEQFAFISNGEIILNGIDGNTTVQLFDVTGRMISCTNGANRISTENMAAGVYMLHLVNGNDVKTQKIVVK